MFDALLEMIRQRMKQLGYTKFKWEPIRVQDAGTTAMIAAHNEYYYLTAKTIPATLVIISDTEVFAEAASYANFQFYNFQEFSGRIDLTQAAPGIDVEFIRVIPTDHD